MVAPLCGAYSGNASDTIAADRDAALAMAYYSYDRYAAITPHLGNKRKGSPLQDRTFCTSTQYLLPCMPQSMYLPIIAEAGAAARPHSSRPLQAHRRCALLWYNTAIQKNAPRSGATSHATPMVAPLCGAYSENTSDTIAADRDAALAMAYYSSDRIRGHHTTFRQ